MSRQACESNNLQSLGMVFKFVASADGRDAELTESC